MATAIVTGSGGLIGSQSVQHFVEADYNVVGIENDMRAWWISDLEPVRRDYPDWEITYGVAEVLREIHDSNAERWLTTP